jgi:hypothetical protein
MYDMGTFTFRTGIVELDKAAIEKYPRIRSAGLPPGEKRISSCPGPCDEGKGSGEGHQGIWSSLADREIDVSSPKPGDQEYGHSFNQTVRSPLGLAL